MSKPICTIIGGVNGSGKTTFALDYLANNMACKYFINVDLIAVGLSPLDSTQQQITANRLFLQQIKQAVARRKNFAFETTLSGKTYLNLIRQLQADGWFVELIYLYLPSVQLSIERVAERVKHGGHDIALTSIARRYPRSINNLVHHYAPLCDSVLCLDNSQKQEKVIFTQTQQDIIIQNKIIYQTIIERAHT